MEKLEGLLGELPVFLSLCSAFVFCAAPSDSTGLSAGALDVELTPEEVKYLEDAYKPLAVFGHA